MKICTYCGRHYTAAAWRKLPAVGHMCLPADETGPEEHLEYRNCFCRTTLVVPVSRSHAGACTLRKSRDVSRRRACDPMTPPEARKLAKTMFRELAKTPPRLSNGHDNPEFFERAAVLADVVLQSDRPDIGEALALAVRGRVTIYSGRFIRMGVGVQLPPGTEATELANAIALAQQVLFPPRQAPCMPNTKELRQLVENEHGTGREARQQLRALTALFRETCGYSSYSLGHIERVMGNANTAIGGHGVLRAAYELDTQSGRWRTIERPVDFYYVNMGDPYNATLIHDLRTRRFRISTWGDEQERAERRFGERGMWRT